MCRHGLYMFFEHEVQFEFILPFVFKSMPLLYLDSLSKDAHYFDSPFLLETDRSSISQDAKKVVSGVLGQSNAKSWNIDCYHMNSSKVSHVPKFGIFPNNIV